MKKTAITGPHLDVDPTRRQAIRFLASGASAFGLTACVGAETLESNADASIADASIADASIADASIADANRADAAADAGNTDFPPYDFDELSADDMACAPTLADAQGPFFAQGSPSRGLIAKPSEPGTRLIVVGQVSRRCQSAAAGYIVDIWQADDQGKYHDALTDYRLRGNVKTDSRGVFAIETIVPGQYGDANGPRPRHLHAKVFRPDGGLVLTTQIYFSGDPYLGLADSCQPPVCRSDDAARITELKDWTVRGTRGHYAIVRLAVE